MSLRYHPDFIVKILTIIFALQIFTAQSLEIEQAIPAETLTLEAVNQEVTVRGKIVSIKESQGENDPLFLALTNPESGQQVVLGYLPNKFVEFHGSLGIPKVGTQVMARGKVWNYNNMLLIKPETLNDLMLEGYPHTYPTKPTTTTPQVELNSAPKQTAPTVVEPKNEAIKPIEYLTIEDFDTFQTLVETEVFFTGVVDHFKPYWSPRAPNIIYVGEGKSTLEIVYWDTEGLLDKKFQEKGQEVFVQGKMQNYKGTLQLKVEDLSLISDSKF